MRLKILLVSTVPSGNLTWEYTSRLFLSVSLENDKLASCENHQSHENSELVITWRRLKLDTFYSTIMFQITVYKFFRCIKTQSQHMGYSIVNPCNANIKPLLMDWCSSPFIGIYSNHQKKIEQWYNGNGNGTTTNWIQECLLWLWFIEAGVAANHVAWPPWSLQVGAELT